MKLSAHKVNLKLSEPLSISFHTFYYAESVIVSLTHNNFTGIGEAAPFKPITGDSQDEVIEQIKHLTDIPLNPEHDSIEMLHLFMNSKNITSETLRAGMDFAYHDLLGKMRNIPTYKLYTSSPKPVDNSITIMLQETPEATAKYAKAVFQKFPDLRILKMKLQGAASDIERVGAVKHIAPKHMKYILDANQGFQNPEEDVHILNEIGNILEHVVLVEQPTPKDDLEKMKYMKEHVRGMLIFADESATTLEEVQKVIDAKAAHGVNIKLQKAGGIWPAKQIAQLCEKNGLQLMVGCMLEGAIGIAAGIHFAVSIPLILSDLDADLEIKDYTNRKLPFENGQRKTNSVAGLGVNIDIKRINRLVDLNEAIYERIL